MKNVYLCIRFQIIQSMKKNALFTLILLIFSIQYTYCEAQVEGHYTYEHAFEYDMDSYYFDVHETGTMDFYKDGTALDSARQVYTVTLADGEITTWVFNYISPSRWRLEGESLFFAGIKENFRMEVMEGDRELEMALKIADTYKRGIDYEYKFLVEILNDEILKWSFTYRDGHSDIWTFYRQKSPDIDTKK